jgi:hypothetical protein
MKFAYQITVSILMTFATSAFAQNPICQLPSVGIPFNCAVISYQYGNQGAATGLGPSDTLCPAIAIPNGYGSCTRVLKCFKAGIDSCSRVSQMGSKTAFSSNQNVYCQNGSLKLDSTGQKDSCQKVIKLPGTQINLPSKKI